jgi:rod shape determining protein RodA
MSLTDTRDGGLGLGQKLLRLDWPVLLLISAAASIGFLMLYAVPGGSFEPWASRQVTRFGLGMVILFTAALIDVRFWRRVTPLAYLGAFALLIAVEVAGTIGMGAQRWIDLGFVQLQPSELMKVTLVMALASYYAWLPQEKVSHPLWLVPPLALIFVPTALVLMQPDLGTAMLLVAGGGMVLFLAGVHWLYFAVATGGVVGLVYAVIVSKGTEWQLLHDYQYRRIFTFLDPASDPLGAGYHITQSTIALGSGGLTGRGFLQGTQTRLNFLPETHTDFIFTALAEQFGLVGGLMLMAIYALIVILLVVAAVINRDRFGSLLIGGVAASFFFAFAVNMAMVMGMAPVGGKPLPLVSYGGTSLMVLLGAFGLAQSAHIHRPD